MKKILVLLTFSLLASCSSLKKVELKYPQYITTKVNYVDQTIEQCQGFYAKDVTKEKFDQVLNAKNVVDNIFIFNGKNEDYVFFGISNNLELETSVMKCLQLTNVMSN